MQRLDVNVEIDDGGKIAILAQDLIEEVNPGNPFRLEDCLHAAAASGQERDYFDFAGEFGVCAVPEIKSAKNKARVKDA